MYDESKRYSEALVTAYRRYRSVNTGLVRIFNTYGPRLGAGDGRLVSSLVAQALAGESLTVHGDGTQTRSLCYVTDLVAGLIAMLDSNEAGPINLGNPVEMSVLSVAEEVRRLTCTSSEVVHSDLREGDPRVRRPDISLAIAQLGWRPSIGLTDGLQRTIECQASLAQ